MSTDPTRLTIPDEAIAEAWSEFRYPRAAVDAPSEGFMRAIRALNTRLPHIVAAELERLAADYDESADCLGEPRMGTPASGMVTVLRDVAEDLRAQATGLRGGSRAG